MKYQIIAFRSELEKISKARWMRELTSGKMAPRDVHRLAAHAGTDANQIHNLAQGSAHRGLRAAHRGGTPEQFATDAASRGLARGDNPLNTAVGESAAALRSARGQMSHVPVSDQKIIQANQRTMLADQQHAKNYKPSWRNNKDIDHVRVSYDDKLHPHRSHLQHQHQPYYNSEKSLIRIGTDGQPAHTIQGAANTRLIRDHEMGEARGIRNISILRSDKAVPTRDTLLHTPMSNHASSVPLAAEYAAVVGNPTAENALRRIRNHAEGVQTDLLRQRGWVNSEQAAKGVHMSPRQDLRLSRQIGREYETKLRGDYIDGMNSMDRSQHAHARMLSNTLPQRTYTNGVDAFTTGVFPGVVG